MNDKKNKQIPVSHKQYQIQIKELKKKSEWIFRQTDKTGSTAYIAIEEIIWAKLHASLDIWPRSKDSFCENRNKINWNGPQ